LHGVENVFDLIPPLNTGLDRESLVHTGLSVMNTARQSVESWICGRLAMAKAFGVVTVKDAFQVECGAVLTIARRLMDHLH
jgi:hypothetical protein